LSVFLYQRLCQSFQKLFPIPGPLFIVLYVLCDDTANIPVEVHKDQIGRGIPIAEIRPIHLQRKDHRPLGLAKGEFEVTPAFFEPLPDEILASFKGDDI